MKNTLNIINSNFNCPFHCPALFLKSHTFTKTEIQHWFSYGSLLGAIRNDSILPWTADVDISIWKPSINEPSTWQQAFAQFLKKEGLIVWRDLRFPSMARICYSKQAKKLLPYQTPYSHPNRYKHFTDVYPYVDLYFAEPHPRDSEDKHIWQIPGPCVFEKTIIFPLKTISIANNSVPIVVPAQPELYLEHTYGKEWRTPIKSKHGGKKLYGCKKNPADFNGTRPTQQPTPIPTPELSGSEYETEDWVEESTTIQQTTKIIDSPTKHL